MLIPHVKPGHFLPNRTISLLHSQKKLSRQHKFFCFSKIYCKLINNFKSISARSTKLGSKILDFFLYRYVRSLHSKKNLFSQHALFGVYNVVKIQATQAPPIGIFGANKPCKWMKCLLGSGPTNKAVTLHSKKNLLSQYEIFLF